MKKTGQPHRLDKNIIPCCHLLRQGKEIQMADFTLSDGREIDIDLSQLTIKEWRSLRDPAQPDEEEFALISRVTGLKVEDVENIKQPDYQLLISALVARSVNPVSDPNS